MALSPPFIRVYLKSANRQTAYFCSGWSSLSVDDGEFGDGQVTLTMPAAALPVPESEMADITKIHNYWIDVFVNSESEPYIKARVDLLTSDWTPENGTTYTLEATAVLEHIAGRKLSTTVNQAKVSSGAFLAPNLILSNILTWAVNTAGGITPTGWPATTDRFNFGPFSVAMATYGGSLFGATTVWYEEQSSNSLMATIQTLGSRYDMYVDVVETVVSGAARFTLGISLFQLGDVTGKFTVDDISGTLAAMTKVVSYRDLATVFMVRGAGDGAGQFVLYQKDTSAFSAWGIYEGVVTLPSASINAIGDEFTQQLKRAIIRETYNVTIRDTRAFRFNVDWRKRDKIAVRCYENGLSVSSTVRSVSFTAANGQPPELINVVIGHTEKDFMDEVLLRLGMGTNGGATDRFTTNSGSPA